MSSPEPPLLRGALVGYGFIGALGHAPFYRSPTSGVQLAAIADASPERLALAQQAFPQAKVYTDWRTLLEREPALDFVDIAVPPVEHAPVALAALSRSLDVLCEKPLAWSLQQADEMLAAARRHRQVLFPCHNYKHAPVVKAVKAIVDGGQLGRVKSLTLSTFRNTHAKGVPEWNTHWRRDRHISGGGIAMDHGSHTFYLAFDWLGSYPTAVTAKVINSEPSRYDTEDNLSAVLTFPNGAAHCHLSWTAGMRKVVYSVQGEAGGLLVNDDQLELALARQTDGPDVAQGAVTWDVQNRAVASHWMDASHVSWFASLFQEFRAAVGARDLVGRETLESYRCLEVIDAVYRSSADRSRELPLQGPSP